MSRDRLVLIALLVGIGAAWGITQPFAKIAVSDGYRHFGIIFWQFAIGALILAPLNALRGGRLPVTGRHVALYTIIALIGTLLPNSASYTAAIHLPSGILSIVLSTVPMLSFPIALALGMDRFSALRLTGLVLGFAAILLIGLPEASLPDPAMVWWLPMALVAPAFYAVEGNFVARYGTEGLDPVQVLLGASAVGLVLSAPLAIMTGQWIAPLPPYGAPDLAIVGSSLAHAMAYAGYVWLVGRAGAVFAAQVSYLVTGCGILWAKLILGESYSPWVWAALALMMVGLFLVQPRKAQPVATAV
ncbi:Permease of the drug/metabolite transporter (DMT) superfamily [Roseibacterium elongatum DSM 19469]|uniref:Permease of the drug/metabolite transporter (DMT) superfamily n=1 Tax=Roseicyclus elongatus DSM 19469 TaxID=1294273 RepID=W8SJR9_9RHOB|nr:DMT family transporter [Roseibacterium elongatum]AHM02760.1 Permease of the drug/metabolite transporter (DMT) superfamily [Roseibacterium elongatum DSM 19469]